MSKDFDPQNPTDEHKVLHQEIHTLQAETNSYLDALQEIFQGVNSRLELAELLTIILGHAARLVNTEHGYIRLLSPNGQEMVQRVGTGLMAQNVGTAIKKGEGLSGQAWATGRSQHVTNYNAWLDRLPIYEGSQLQDLMCVPLKSGSDVIGIIGLARADGDRNFSADDIATLDRFAVLAAVAWDNAMLYDEVQKELAERRQAELAERQQRRLSEILQAAATALTKTRDLSATLETLLDYLAQLVLYDSASVMLLNDDNQLVIHAIRGFENWTKPEEIIGRTFEIGSSYTLGQIINSRETFLIADTHQTAGWQRPPGTDYIRSWLGVPLKVDEAVIGVYSMDKAEVNFFTEEHARLAETLASHGAVAIQNARLLKDLTESNTRLQELVSELEQLRETEMNQRRLAEAISSTTAMLNRSLNTREVFEGILNQVDKVVPADASSILFIKGDVAEVAHVRGHDEEVIGFQIPLQQANFQEAMASGQPVVIPDTYNSDIWIVAPETAWIRSSATVAITVGGEVIGFLGIDSKKINAFKPEHIQSLQTFANQGGLAVRNARLFSEVQSAKQFSESIVQNSPVAIITIDAGARVTSWNPAAEELFGYASDEVFGRELDALITTAELVEEARYFSRQTLSGTPVRTVTQRCRRDGVLIDVEVFSVPIDPDNPETGFIAIYHNITELKATEAALEQAKLAAEAANEAKSSFLANMSHELRTPLNAIIGYSEMLSEDFEDEGLDEFIPDLEKIRSAGKHLLALINEVLDLSKIEAGKMELYLETFNVGEMIAAVLDTARPLVEKNNNILETNIDPNLGTMRADLVKVRQSMLNLLSNAAKFTEEGTIKFTAERREHEGLDWITMRVSDSGIGMTAEQLGRLFQAFSQAETSTSRKYGGTGLGLDISRRFCRMMGGDITVESQYGVGSTFIITLPALVEEMQNPDSAAVEAASGESLIDATTILVVDDDPAVRDLMQRFLGKEGFQVLVASGGEEGLELAHRFNPDVITLDVLMPGMDGWEVIAQLKDDPELAHIPIIMVTIMDNHSLGYALGASEFLTKPVDRDRLLSVLEKFDHQLTSHDVLVVEDDPATSEILMRILAGAGWTAAAAQNGKIALEKLTGYTPALILLDLMMPEMDGFQFVSAVREHPLWQQIPIVVITAKDLTSEEKQRLKGSVSNIFDKGSYSREELLDEVKKLVANSL